jgi:GTPase
MYRILAYFPAVASSCPSLEVADVFVVNKADRGGADQAVRDLRYMLSLGGRQPEPGAWWPPIVRTVASQGECVEARMHADAG